MSDQYSPLPLPLILEIGDGFVYVWDSGGASVAIDDEMDVETAAFIVRACNRHAELLAALKELRDVAAAWCRVSMNHPGLAEELHAAVQQIGIADGFGVRAQAAIAKAEGR